jgi:hypothetical protein
MVRAAGRAGGPAAVGEPQHTNEEAS